MLELPTLIDLLEQETARFSHLSGVIHSGEEIAQTKEKLHQIQVAIDLKSGKTANAAK